MKEPWHAIIHTLDWLYFSSAWIIGQYGQVHIIIIIIIIIILLLMMQNKYI